jgi:signal transduction histidine kinase
VRLRQILSNLLGNAVKFTERGGITVSVEYAGPCPGGIALRFSVADTGSASRRKSSGSFSRRSPSSTGPPRGASGEQASGSP